jgi:hypothetical protein
MKYGKELTSDRCGEKWWETVVASLKSLSTPSTKNHEKSIRKVYVSSKVQTKYQTGGNTTVLTANNTENPELSAAIDALRSYEISK